MMTDEEEMNANFEYYKVFYYVSKYENLTKAAAVLKTSQPAVTRTIHNLENILGCRLFIRSKSGMQLTPEGRIFYEYVAAGCAQFFKGEDNLNNLISLENGTIYISATETALHCYLFEAIRDFNIQYPNVHFKILNNSTTDSVNALKEGKIDLAVVSAFLQVSEPLKMKVVRKYKEILIGGTRFEGKESFTGRVVLLSLGQPDIRSNYQKLPECIFCQKWTAVFSGCRISNY
jgi:DNA-binding transcriptional LysR family regulator